MNRPNTTNRRIDTMSTYELVARYARAVKVAARHTDYADRAGAGDVAGWRLSAAAHDANRALYAAEIERRRPADADSVIDRSMAILGVDPAGVVVA